MASGIRRDSQAVRNALTLEWSSGRVEGLNTRAKLLKLNAQLLALADEIVQKQHVDWPPS